MAAPSQCLFSWGANSYGQLGIGNTIDMHVPHKVESPPNEEIKCITGGGGHSVIITGAGTVYVCGWNSKGQLGLGHLEDQTTFQKVANIPAIAKVSCGWEHTLAITEHGLLYSWGANNFKQLGQNVNILLSTPAKVQELEGYVVVDIAAGLRHSIALTASSQVWVWGAGSKGQLGIHVHGSIPSIVAVPQQVQLGQIRVKQVAAGSLHSIILTDDDKLIVWGCNKRGQLGELPHSPDTGEGKQRASLPKRLPTHALKINKVNCGWTHSVFQTHDGRLFSWGRADYGQLGRIDEDPLKTSQTYADGCCYVPRQVESADKMSQIVCGSEHNLALTADNRLFAWGWNEHGTCADGTTDNVYMPKLIPALKGWQPDRIGGGYGHCFVVCKCT